MTRTATAEANPNIALIKYWVKRDESLILPVAGSLSMTLDAYPTTTTVTVDGGADHDRCALNGVDLDPHADSAGRRISQFLDLVRELAGTEERAVVHSVNEAPTAAGLASSAAGFAALALAASRAYGLDLSERELSRLARRGSGSASRSVIDRFAVWHAGTDDESSYAEAISAPDMRMIVCTVSGSQKKVSSREGMLRTKATSPYFASWVSSTEAVLRRALDACAAGDFTTLGELTELHAYRMHALIESCEPPIRYLAPASYAAFDRIAELREAGVETYGTADAGPNVVAVSRPDDAEAVADALEEFGETTVVAPGRGARAIRDRVNA